MKTAKIEKIIKVNPWTGSNGVVFYHQLEMDNGDKIEIGKKTELAIGQELTYEITDSQQEYNKAKAVNPNYSAGGYSKQFKKGTGSSSASFALSYAKDVYTAHGANLEDLEPGTVANYICALADEFLSWLNDNSSN